MPLTGKGEKIKSAMTKEYGPEKGEEVFYASKNKGAISGVDAVLGLSGGRSGGLATVHGPSGKARSGVDDICGYKHE